MHDVIGNTELETGSARDAVRGRIIAAAAELLTRGGRDATTTRAVAAAAGVQAPTIYRLFGDMRGLLDAVAEHGLAAYIAEKLVREPHPDALQDLRDGWDMHVTFGLTHPGLFAILSVEQRPGPPSAAMAAGHDVLRRRIRNIALAGRLTVSEARAAALFQAMGVGTVLTLLGLPEAQRDPGLAVAAREAVISAITGEAIPSLTSGASAAATTLIAALDQTTVLTDGERHLLEELLHRIADGRQRPDANRSQQQGRNLVPLR